MRKGGQNLAVLTASHWEIRSKRAISIRSIVRQNVAAAYQGMPVFSTWRSLGKAPGPAPIGLPSVPDEVSFLLWSFAADWSGDIRPFWG